MSIGSKKDWDEYLEERFCKVPPRMRTPTPPTLVVIEEMIESPMDLRVPSPKKEQTMPAIEGFVPLILSLPGIAKPSPRFVQKGIPVVPTIRGFDPLILPKPI